MSTLKEHAGLILGLPTLAALGLLQSSVDAQSADCQKTCGCNATQNGPGTRESGCSSPSECVWVTCTGHVHNCGYSDNNNDSCGALVFCGYQSCNTPGSCWGS